KVEKEDTRREWHKKIQQLTDIIIGIDEKSAKEAESEFMSIRDTLAFDAIEKIVTHRSDYIRYITVQLLANFKPDNITKILVERTLVDSCKAVRTESVKSLRAAECETAYTYLLKAFFYNTSSNVRNNAVDALCILKDKNSIAPLIEVIAYEPRMVVSAPNLAPDFFFGNISRKVIGYKIIVDSFGRKFEVPEIGTVLSSWSSGPPKRLVDNVIFNLGAREILKSLISQDFNYNKPEWRNWWKENESKFDRWLESKKD
ncbi:MAG: hypothetical protein ABIH42_05050, partial [Planctomycetota bacterium]